jgi:hypothetical protein
MTTRVLTVVLVALAAGCARPSGVAPSGGRYTNQVDTYLARQAETERGQGYTRWVAGPVHGRLRNGNSGTHSMTVVGGNSYVLFGQCDNDCTDLDLKIYDPNGTLLMQDVAVDDHPTLEFKAYTSGQLRVEAIMARCNVNPCFYGLELLSR